MAQRFLGQFRRVPHRDRGVHDARRRCRDCGSPRGPREKQRSRGPDGQLADLYGARRKDRALPAVHDQAGGARSCRPVEIAALDEKQQSCFAWKAAPFDTEWVMSEETGRRLRTVFGALALIALSGPKEQRMGDPEEVTSALDEWVGARVSVRITT